MHLLYMRLVQDLHVSPSPPSMPEIDLFLHDNSGVNVRIDNPFPYLKAFAGESRAYTAHAL